MTREGAVDFECPNCERIGESAGDGCNFCGYGYAEDCETCDKPRFSKGLKTPSGVCECYATACEHGEILGRCKECGVI